MVMRKRKKNIRMRGSHTHGWGSKKKHRGSGNRGGKGMAGTGKRADQKKPSIIKEYGNTYFGKSGFRRKAIMTKLRIINIKDLEKYENKVDLKEKGFDKLLGSGKINKKIEIKADFASRKAIDKIKKAGGNVILKDGNSKPNNS